MDWYKEYNLIKDGSDDYILEIQLNLSLVEFSDELMENIKESVLSLDSQIRELVNEKFKGVKISTVKLMIGAIIIATIPIAGTPMVSAATTATATSTYQASTATIYYATGTVTATKLNMRTGPSTSYAIFHVLWQGMKVPIIAQTPGWYQIRLSDGRTGWVSKDYMLSSMTRQQKIDTVIGTAKSLIGTPYVWGGESLAEGGFDCSGFAFYCFQQAGFTLNRVSAEQAKQGVAVSRANLQPGDLVFSDIAGTGSINHVGIYIGGGMMIHSPKTGDYVKTTDITTSYWTSRFITARRIF